MSFDNFRGSILLPIAVENQFLNVTEGDWSLTSVEDDSKKISWELDSNALTYLAVELISQGAEQIYVDQYSGISKGIDDLPISLKSRVHVLDGSGKYWRKAAAVLKPIYDEYRFEFEDMPELLHSFLGMNAMQLHNESDADRRKKLSTLNFLHANLYHFLLGVFSGCQIDIDSYGLMINLERVKADCRSAEALAVIATLMGILGNYRHSEVGALTALDGITSNRIIENLEDFLQNREFAELVDNNQKLGFGERTQHFLERSGALSKKLLNKGAFKEVFNYGAKSITVATGIPLPNSNLGEALLENRFLPPIIKFRDSITLARNRWDGAHGEAKSMTISPPDYDQRAISTPKKTNYQNGKLVVEYDVFDIFESFRFENPISIGSQEASNSLKQYLLKNFDSSTTCSKHQRLIEREMISIDIGTTDMSIRIDCCCEVAGIRSYFKLMCNSAISEEEAESLCDKRREAFGAQSE